MTLALIILAALALAAFLGYLDRRMKNYEADYERGQLKREAERYDEKRGGRAL